MHSFPSLPLPLCAPRSSHTVLGAQHMQHQRRGDSFFHFFSFASLSTPSPSPFPPPNPTQPISSFTPHTACFSGASSQCALLRSLSVSSFFCAFCLAGSAVFFCSCLSLLHSILHHGESGRSAVGRKVCARCYCLHNPARHPRFDSSYRRVIAAALPLARYGLRNQMRGKRSAGTGLHAFRRRARV